VWASNRRKRVVKTSRLQFLDSGLFARDDGFGLHTLAAGLAALRTRSRSPSK